MRHVILSVLLLGLSFGSVAAEPLSGSFNDTSRGGQGQNTAPAAPPAPAPVPLPYRMAI
ncbi:MAG: hypothetical protein GYB53_04005 [Rhodobacteraceae bacterium]|nr:hypothetical protein [Paracoccaceae bacterium]MBR9819566.1 hypothetical protein [Paracoccaceae bacterium]